MQDSVQRNLRLLMFMLSLVTFLSTRFNLYCLKLLKSAAKDDSSTLCGEISTCSKKVTETDFVQALRDLSFWPY